jgi:protein-S-isoprenylcysteine O-methyltransferase Ste14
MPADSERTHRMSRLYGLVQTTLFLALAVTIFLDRSPELFASSRAWRIGGGVVALGGLGLMLAAIRTIGRSIQIAPAPKTDATLVTRGVYARFRHPIYTGIVAVVAGLFLRQPTMAVAIAGGVTTAFLLVKARFEERLLARRYQDYEAYCTRAWGVIPFLL